MLEAALAAGIASAGGDVLARRRAADAGRAAADRAATASTWRSSSPPRTTPTPTTGSSSSAATASSSPTTTEREIELHIDEDVGGGGARIGRIRRAARQGARTTSRELQQRFAGLSLAGLDVRARLRQRRDLSRSRRRSSRASARSVTALAASRPTGATSTPTAARRTSDALARAVRDGGHDVGFAFDGDGDRVLAVDRHGNLVDGDELLALAALHLRDAGGCRGRRRRDGDDELRLPHRDGGRPGSRSRPRRSATATCSRRCASAAGRSAASSRGTSSSSASRPRATGSPRRCSCSRRWAAATCASAAAMAKLPQRLVNVRRARPRGARATPPRCTTAVAQPRRQQLDGRGRVLVRPSGTEPLVRVMVEAPSVEETDAVCARLVAVVQELFG